MSKEKRSAVVALHDANMSAPQISKLLKIPVEIVRYMIKRYNETGDVKDRPRSGRPVTACTAGTRAVIQKRLDRQSKRSLRGMARSIGISDWSVRKIVKRQLGYRSYKISKAQLLTEQMKLNRLKKCRKMKRLAAAGRHQMILFTDEKLFSIQQAHNSQNDRQVLPDGPEHNQHKEFVSRSHFPASVMVWAGVTATGKTPLVFVEKGVKINAKVYQDTILKAVVDPWAKRHFKKTPWTLQQDWAPAHSAKTTIDLCNELFPNVWTKEIWPSNSPDLNPLDYAVWSILEQRVCTKAYKSPDSLKRALIKAWDEISVDELTAIIDNFPKRLNACITAQGGHFEHLL